MFGKIWIFCSTVLPFKFSRFLFTVCIALSLKICLSNKNKNSDILFAGLIEAIQFCIGSRRIVSLATARYQCFLDDRTFMGLEFLLSEVQL